MIGDYLSVIGVGVPWTIALTISAFATGLVLGLPICAVRMSSFGAARWSAKLVVLVVRSIPPIVWLFFIFFGLGSEVFEVNPFQAAWVGLGLIAAVNMAEIYRGAFTAIHVGQREAAMALGLPLRHRLADILAPQVVRIAAPSAATLAIGLLKDTAIASTIGVHEIAFQTYHLSQRTFRGLDIFLMAGFCYITISIPMAWFAHYADRTMRRRLAR